MAQNFDVVIIGGGPGGAAAASLLAKGGKNVAIVESARLGGVCLNCGCIPTKFLLGATSVLGGFHDQAKPGVISGDLSVNFTTLQQRKDRFIKGSSNTLAKTLANVGVSIFNGKGSITAKNTVTVEGETSETLTAKDIILAVGSRSAAFPGLTPDGAAVLDSTMLLALENVPQSLIIVGAGAIGLEFSDFFSAMGTQVTIVEGLPQIAPTEDADIGKELQKIYEKSGRTCITGEKVSSLVTKNGQAVLTLSDGRELTAEKALIAVGRKPNTEGLGVEVTGGTLNPRGFVVTDESLGVAENVYAIGDVNGRVLLAHAAEHQAAYVASKILGETAANYVSGPVPSCIYGHVEVMRVGKSAKEALADNDGDIFVSKVPFTINPIAQAHAATGGFVKAVWKDDTLVGMAALGHSASHLVTAAQLLVLHNHKAGDHSFMFAHPTLDELLSAALNAPKTPFIAV